MKFGQRLEGLLKIKKGTKEQKTNVDIDSLLNSFVYGNTIGQNDILLNLEISEIPKFQESVTVFIERIGEEGTSDRAVIFKINQLRSLLEKDLEMLIRKLRGEDVIERWN